MRIVYRFNEEVVWILAIRARKPGGLKDVYRIGNLRVIHEKASTYRARKTMP